VVGALKAAARTHPADKSELASLRKRIGNRPIWLAAATHVTEEPVIIAAHEIVLQECPDALLIVAPRDLDSAADLESNARAKFKHVARRGDGQLPDGATQVYIADTFGEMGLWYRIAPISFISHSLLQGADDLAGKNPYEAIALGSAVIHGSSVSYFSETYQDLLSMGAPKEVKTPMPWSLPFLRCKMKMPALR
jgi:3-deoxy-D-manno-octulosonic-acid transferase